MSGSLGVTRCAATGFYSIGFIVGNRKPGLISLKFAGIITPRTCTKLLKASHGNILWLKPVFRIVRVARTQFHITLLNSSRYWRLNWWVWRLGIIVGEKVRTQGFHLSLNIIADKASFFNRFEQFSAVKSVDIQLMWDQGIEKSDWVC